MDEELFPLHNNSLVSETEDQHEVVLHVLVAAALEHIFHKKGFLDVRPARLH